MSEKAKTLSTTVTTPIFRASYPSLFKPKLNTLNNKEEFSVEALFPLEEKMSDADKAAFKSLKIAAKNACIKNWGEDESKWPKNLRNPFKDQASKEKEGKLADGLVKGAIFMTLKADASKSRPAIVDQNRQEIIEEHKFYAGCYARASVNAFAYPKKGSKGGMQPGVSFGLNAVQFVKDGEPFSGRPSIEDAFEAIPELETEGGKDASSLF